MLPTMNKFQQLDVFERPARILTGSEKEYILSLYPRISIQTISIDDWLCIELGAIENDIICIRDHNTDIYRRVIGRYPLL